jgi:hypothetical protein
MIAVDFLTKHGFSYDKVFQDGVQYLSRAEEEYLHEDFIARTVKQSRNAVEVDPKDEQAVELVKEVRSKLDKWLAKSKVSKDQN